MNIGTTASGLSDRGGVQQKERLPSNEKAGLERRLSEIEIILRDTPPAKAVEVIFNIQADFANLIIGVLGRYSQDELWHYYNRMLEITQHPEQRDYTQE